MIRGLRDAPPTNFRPLTRRQNHIDQLDLAQLLRWPEGQGLHDNAFGKIASAGGARRETSCVKNPHLCAMIEYAKILAAKQITGELGLGPMPAERLSSPGQPAYR